MTTQTPRPRLPSLDVMAVRPWISNKKVRDPREEDLMCSDDRRMNALPLKCVSFDRLSLVMAVTMACICARVSEDMQTPPTITRGGCHKKHRHRSLREVCSDGSNSWWWPTITSLFLAEGKHARAQKDSCSFESSITFWLLSKVWRGSCHLGNAGRHSFQRKVWLYMVRVIRCQKNSPRGRG